MERVLEKQTEIQKEEKEFETVAVALLENVESLHEKGFELGPHQEDAIDALIDAISDGKTSGYVEMATSTGKTVIESLLAEAAVDADKRVLILAPRINTAEQISGTSASKSSGLEKFTDLHLDNVVRHHFGGRRTDNSGQVVISTYHGFLNEAKTGYQTLGDFDVLIADECHHSLGAETSKALRSAYPDALKIGFSATPDYAADRKSSEIFDKPIYEYSLLDAIEAGVTSPVRSLIYETDDVLHLSDRQEDFSDKELAPLINSMERNGIAAKIASDLVKNGRKGIISCIRGRNNIHARFMADLLSQSDYGGITAKEVGSHLTREENALRLKEFEEGKLDILTFTKLIEEGWDSLAASFCINLAPTTSPVRTKQLLGRILRKKDSGIDSIYIDFIDKQAGLRKGQYTSLHALELETVDATRIVGVRNNNQDQSNVVYNEVPELSKDVYEKILKSQGRLLSNIVTTPTPNKKLSKYERLQRRWNYILEGSNLPEDLLYNSIISRNLINKFKKSKHELVASLGIEPTNSEIVDNINNLSEKTKKALGQIGTYSSLDSLSQNDFFSDTNLVQSEDEIYDTVFNGRLREHFANLFDTLTPREELVLRMRYGLYDPETIKDISERLINIDGDKYNNDVQSIVNKVKAGEYLTLQETGLIAGRVSRDRARQIEAKALRKMRHPSRSKGIRGYR